jgi:hypothetical protein
MEKIHQNSRNACAVCYTKRMTSVIPNQKKGIANLKDINPFSVLSGSG